MASQHLLFATDPEKAKSEIIELQGHVLQVFNSDILVVMFNDSVNVASLKHSQPSPHRKLDANAQILVEAWHTRDSAPKRPEEMGEKDGLSWSHPGFDTPSAVKNDPDIEFGIQVPNSEYMKGSVAVGIWIIQGPTSDLQFTTAETNNVIQSVHDGLNFWARSDPRSKLTFIYDFHQVSINAPASTQSCDKVDCEAVFRDPALKVMGYTPGKASVDKYVSHLKSALGTNSAYMVFVVKYPLIWPAYNSHSNGNSSYICMSYSNGNWGASKLNSTFAHETGHSFGALDEYGGKRNHSTCNDVSGSCNVPNHNHVDCVGSQHQDCIMDKNVLDVCQWTRGQVGWQYCNSGFQTSLPKTGSEIVNVVASGHYSYHGSDGRCFKLDAKGKILNTNTLPKRGQHEVRLVPSEDGKTLFVGTDGYALALSTSDLATKWQTSLPGTGSNIVSVVTRGSSSFYGSDGHCFTIDENGKILNTNNLPKRDQHEVRLVMSDDGETLFVGTDGYALALSTSDLTTKWERSLPHTGSSSVDVLYSKGYLFAGSNGFVYKIDANDGAIESRNDLPNRGRHKVRLAYSKYGEGLFVGTDGYALCLDPSNLRTKWQTSLPGASNIFGSGNVVNLMVSEGYLFAGSVGHLYGLDLTFGSIMYANNLPDRGRHEVRLASANHTIYLGTDGYALSVRTHSSAPYCSY